MAPQILVSFPGRAGDLLWSLPTVRAISESYGVPVDLQICGEFASMVDLLLQQPYLAGVTADPRWGMTMGWEAPEHPRRFDRVIHLGYRRWPELPLPLEVYDGCRSREVGLPLMPLDLDRPWITVKPLPMRRVAVGWSDCYFELKYGLTELVFPHGGNTRYAEAWHHPYLLPALGSRWVTEAGYSPCDWLEAAQRIAGAKAFLGDCSALHVLAVALGKPVVLYEPMEARWNPIFYPYGKVGPQVRLVVGLDGLPTQDSRHTADALREVLGG